MPTVTNTVTVTADDGSSTTTTKTETSERFMLSPELAPDLQFGGVQEHFALSVPAEKAGPIVAKFHSCSECPAFGAMGEWEMTGPTDSKGGFRTITMPGAHKTRGADSVRSVVVSAVSSEPRT